MTTTDPVIGPRLGRPSTMPTSHGLGSADWREELVELLVLTEHGDSTAAVRLRDWVARDSAAQDAYNSIARDIEALRAP